MSGTSDSGAVPAAPVLTTPQEWRKYLREYSELYLRTADEYQRRALEPEQEATRWMGHEPAAEEAVLSAEQRLGVRFPPMLRSFLLTSNGWSGVGGWVDLVYPCERVSWMRDTDGGSDLIGTYRDFSDEDDEYLKLFQLSLEIASGEDFWLLDPTQTGPDGEWAAYLYEPKYGELEEFAGFVELFHASWRDMETSGGKRPVVRGARSGAEPPLDAVGE
ncbi:SMI1/KNR4 family protein [Streptomyces cavernae]|uniref:SMI1/KNR4 family protein n=1 Tax=Streptomyces cavernae TaxID=2259034 RepID=UPI001EE3B29D|nr:SMI1/KNR4 family protein [Streptomyces cavernae]